MIDIERLKWDESMWPEGAEWFLDRSKFVKWVGGTEYWLNENQSEWMPLANSWTKAKYLKAGSLFHVIPRPEPRQVEWPESGSKWEHHSGRVYVVVDIANGKTERPEQYPVTVIYQNVDNGTFWSRPLNDWARSFKPYRTKQQRQREELEYLIESAYATNGVEGVADAMQSSYTMEPKQ